MVSDAVKTSILSVLFKYLPKEEVVIFLFGSFAKGEMDSSSDIDIGLLSDQPLERSVLARVRDDLGEHVQTLRNVDVIDFSNITDPVFLKEALQEIEIWHQTQKSRVCLDNLRKHIKGF
ncbi:MAG: nucleotidyltransferase domain-containing protein [Chlamydiae bacterium]|nr:nucleotidyltransferase domain-containing protein [Chlamydiota bacterium]MBI3265856.1 nucleotidyltransferase domain-containing protein [Chlamydiota bacterium]